QSCVRESIKSTARQATSRATQYLNTHTVLCSMVDTRYDVAARHSCDLVWRNDMKRLLVLCAVLATLALAGCGSSSASPTATPKPQPTPTAMPTTPSGATPTPVATAAAQPSSTGVIGNIPVWCHNLGSAQTEVNKLNAQMGGNPS